MDYAFDAQDSWNREGCQGRTIIMRHCSDWNSFCANGIVKKRVFGLKRMRRKAERQAAVAETARCRSARRHKPHISSTDH
jgi:hypothetical protein